MWRSSHKSERAREDTEGRRVGFMPREATHRFVKREAGSEWPEGDGPAVYTQAAGI